RRSDVSRPDDDELGRRPERFREEPPLALLDVARDGTARRERLEAGRDGDLVDSLIAEREGPRTALVDDALPPDRGGERVAAPRRREGDDRRAAARGLRGIE